MKIKRLLKIGQAGFSHVEAFVGLFVVAVIAVVGVYVGVHNGSHAAPITSTIQSSSTAPNYLKEIETLRQERAIPLSQRSSSSNAAASSSAVTEASAGTGYLAGGLKDGQCLYAGQSVSVYDGTAAKLIMQTDGNAVLYAYPNQTDLQRGVSDTVIWNTHTGGTGSSNYLCMQSDGNLVLYHPTGSTRTVLYQSYTANAPIPGYSGTPKNYDLQIQWASDTTNPALDIWFYQDSGGGGATNDTQISPLGSTWYSFPDNNDTQWDFSLARNQELVSTNGRYTAIFQTAGNFVVYDHDYNGTGKTQAIFDSSSSSNPSASLITQVDYSTGPNATQYNNFQILNTNGATAWNSTSWLYNGNNTAATVVMQNDGNLVAYDSAGAWVWQTYTHDK